MIKIDKDKYPILIELLESGTEMDQLQQQIADLQSKIAEKQNGGDNSNDRKFNIINRNLIIKSFCC